MAIPKPAPGQGKWWVIGVVGVAVMTAFATWFGISASRGVDFGVAQVNNINDRSIELVFNVGNQDGKSVTCDLEAQDYSHNEVGVANVTLPPTKKAVAQYTVTIKTVSKAVTALVDSCNYN